MNFLYKFNNLIQKVGLFIAGIALLAMVIITVGDVIMRNAFDQPVSGSYEIIEYFLMPLMVLPAVPFAYRSGILPKLGELKEKFRPFIRKVIDFVIQAIEIFISGIVAYYSFVFAMTGMEEGVAQAVGLTLIPIWPVYFFLPFAFGFVCLEAILITINMLASKNTEINTLTNEKTL